MSKSQITNKQIIKLAKLAKLDLTVAESNLLTNQFTEIINYFNKLKRLNIKNIKPTSRVTGLTNIFREDKIDQSLKLPARIYQTKPIF